MNINQVRCEVIDVRTDTGTCPGKAGTQKGEKYIIDGRTPESKGICTNAFCAIHSMLFMMMKTNKMEWEKDYHDLVCPHGYATFRISRINNL